MSYVCDCTWHRTHRGPSAAHQRGVPPARHHGRRRGRGAGNLRAVVPADRRAARRHRIATGMVRARGNAHLSRHAQLCATTQGTLRRAVDTRAGARAQAPRIILRHHRSGRSGHPRRIRHDGRSGRVGVDDPSRTGLVRNARHLPVLVPGNQRDRRPLRARLPPARVIGSPPRRRRPACARRRAATMPPP